MSLFGSWMPKVRPIMQVELLELLKPLQSSGVNKGAKHSRGLLSELNESEAIR